MSRFLLPADFLPNPKQSWAHSVCSKKELKDALEDSNITAIETDIVMGKDLIMMPIVSKQNEDDTTRKIDTTGAAGNGKVLVPVDTYSKNGGHDETVHSHAGPIMAHPPNTESDLSSKRFFQMSIADRSNSNTNSNTDKVTKKSDRQGRGRGRGRGRQYKHLKLDFKEPNAIDPVLDDLYHMLELHAHEFDKDMTIFLNADILPGPGKRYRPRTHMDSKIFIRKCLQFLNKEANCKKNIDMTSGNPARSCCAFSLGWQVDCRSLKGYTNEDIDAMRNLMIENELLECSRGIVLAVNARVLGKDPSVFDSILKDFPQIQLLVWTGNGEPPISLRLKSSIEKHFQSLGCLEKVGFDCQIATSFISGAFYDAAVTLIALPWNARQYFWHHFRGAIHIQKSRINHRRDA